MYCNVGSPLCRADRSLENSVVEVIDHHRLERAQSSSCRVTVEMVGSCATLVTERIVQKASEILDEQMAKLLYGRCLVDELIKTTTYLTCVTDN